MNENDTVYLLGLAPFAGKDEEINDIGTNAEVFLNALQKQKFGGGTVYPSVTGTHNFVFVDKEGNVIDLRKRFDEKDAPFFKEDHRGFTIYEKTPKELIADENLGHIFFVQQPLRIPEIARRFRKGGYKTVAVFGYPNNFSVMSYKNGKIQCKNYFKN